ncbi:hypothetical protein CPB97_001578 [Podila verticillata]|nr:hypothetical protein CPB97_001578 [Podila verticillata]
MTLPTPANPGPFGHKQRKNFLFDDNFTNYNHGSYGSFPKSVQENLLKWQNHAELNPDRWVRRELKDALAKVRGQVAEYINCDVDELVLVQNTTVGINSVMRSIKFVPGDRILQLSTGYGAVNKTIEYICNTHTDVKVVEVELVHPQTDHAIVHLIEKTVQDHLARKDGSRVRLAMIDWISSVPAVVLPVKQITDMLKSYGILVCIDAAHAIGQVPMDLRYLDADFVITNCHKWLYSVRGSAALYIRKKFQQVIHPVTITAEYKVGGFHPEFAWVGTLDYANMLSIEGGLAFRAQYGDSAIMHYCHRLAIEGGQVMAHILGTNVLTTIDHQTGFLANVRLPIKDINHPKIATPDFLIEYQQDMYNIFAPLYKHGGSFWTRVSAQIYLELSDFVRLGHILKEVVEMLNRETEEGEKGKDAKASL